MTESTPHPSTTEKDKKPKKKSKKKPKIEKAVHQLVKQYFRHVDTPEQQGLLHQELICRVERELIKTVFKKANGNQSQCAKILGLSRTTLRKKLTQLKIDR